MRRLAFLTQAVDPAHPALAATIPKIRALAARVDEVVVLAQSVAPAELPPNVVVRRFGSRSRPGRLIGFERELLRALPADGVVAHMIPLYVLLAAPLVRPRRIPLVLWYTHWKASRQLRIAEKLATAIVSVDERSFPLRSPKVRAIGHGIDVSEFPCTEHEAHDGVRALVLGRYSPAKGLKNILLAARDLGGVELDVRGAALNAFERRHRDEDLAGFDVPLREAVPRSDVPSLFARSDVLVNNMEAGAPDKVVYEAAAACLPVLASNPVFDDLFEGYPLFFERDSPQSLADRLRWFMGLSSDERAEIGRTLRQRVARSHSVETWADGVIAAATA
jgi:glycosyltransferase involved in cell wall biosynthesis